uniref:FAM65 N-terminal domain-containing protein n=1 Tax=Ditylenchus dipsaci TaxID=166011 RepID=A0A915DX97_9BILA
MLIVLFPENLYSNHNFGSSLDLSQHPFGQLHGVCNSTEVLDQVVLPKYLQQPSISGLLFHKHKYLSSSNLLLKCKQTDPPLPNFLICDTDLAHMAAIQAEMMGMVGRLHFEVKAIVGFARITSGDVFEITIKHGNQRWKSRGKTQPDKTQKWEQTTVVLDCLGDSPVLIKVVEVKFFKSRCLNERSFDPVKFFSHQPQLVTMNLNSIGSLKLQLIVTWLPLLSSKTWCNPKPSQPAIYYQECNPKWETFRGATPPPIPCLAPKVWV